MERLATAIRLGVYPDGSSLPPERELSVRMGVSRATLREAIAALRTAKLVRTTRGRAGGTVVDHPPVTPGEEGAARPTTPRPVLMDSLVYRRIVEPGACYLAASRPLTEDQRTLLTDAHAAVEEAAGTAEHRQADSRLHLAIASLTGSTSWSTRSPASRRTCTRCSSPSRCCRSTSTTPAASTPTS